VADEETLAALLEAGDLHGAASQAIEAFGPEVFGFLVSLMRDEHDASDVFAQACEDLWRGLPGFEQRSTLRTWFYMLARHAASRYRRAPHRRAERRAQLSEADGIAERVRTRTLQHLRTEVKDQFALIRDALEPEDRALLVLRVDRKLAWNDIARVLCEESLATGEDLARASARLRKRFELVKHEIRERAQRAGLIRDRDA
jgi:RNA polymerase sigma-70 factor (ECF subfamily)